MYHKKFLVSLWTVGKSDFALTFSKCWIEVKTSRKIKTQRTQSHRMLTDKQFFLICQKYKHNWHPFLRKQKQNKKNTPTRKINSLVLFQFMSWQKLDETSHAPLGPWMPQQSSRNNKSLTSLTLRSKSVIMARPVGKKVETCTTIKKETINSKKGEFNILPNWPKKDDLFVFFNFQVRAGTHKTTIYAKEHCAETHFTQESRSFCRLDVPSCSMLLMLLLNMLVLCSWWVWRAWEQQHLNQKPRILGIVPSRGGKHMKIDQFVKNYELSL